MTESHPYQTIDLFVFFFPGPLFSQQLGAQKIHKYKRA
jgi:hypothetical protein